MKFFIFNLHHNYLKYILTSFGKKKLTGYFLSVYLLERKTA